MKRDSEKEAPAAIPMRDDDFEPLLDRRGGGAAQDPPQDPAADGAQG